MITFRARSQVHSIDEKQGEPLPNGGASLAVLPTLARMAEDQFSLLLPRSHSTCVRAQYACSLVALAFSKKYRLLTT